jgi:WD40 repeat protein
VIRNFDKGDIVYYTGNRTREIYVVKWKPRKGRPYYILNAIVSNSTDLTIRLYIDRDDPTWDCVFVDPTEALNDAKRRQQEFQQEQLRQLQEKQRQFQRKLDEWKELYVSNKDDLLKTMYQAWAARDFYSPPFDILRPESDISEARKQIVIECIKEFFDVDVK